jgi:hypothetical protein
MMTERMYLAITSSAFLGLTKVVLDRIRVPRII